MSLRSDKEAARDLIRSGSGLFDLIHRFNIHPAAYAHPTWFEPLLPADLFLALRKTRRGATRLSKMLLQQHDLSNETCYDFEYRRWRFALLPSDVLAKLTLYCGLASLHRQIATLVEKEALGRIKKSLDEKDYLFAVKRAPLIIGQMHGIDLYWNGHCDVGRLAGHYGTAYFLSHFTDAPRAVSERLAFKFSRHRQKAALEKPSNANGWHLFKRILVHEVAPRWQPLFS